MNFFDWWTARAFPYLNTWRVKLEEFYIQWIYLFILYKRFNMS